MLRGGPVLTDGLSPSTLSYSRMSTLVKETVRWSGAGLFSPYFLWSDSWRVREDMALRRGRPTGELLSSLEELEGVCMRMVGAELEMDWLRSEPFLLDELSKPFLPLLEGGGGGELGMDTFTAEIGDCGSAANRDFVSDPVIDEPQSLSAVLKPAGCSIFGGDSQGDIEEGLLLSG